MSIRRLNHAVLYVRDARVSAAFYREALGFITVQEDAGGRFAFIRGAKSDNHHDLGLFSVGESAGPSAAGRSSVGMYHLAWEVDTLEELVEVRQRLVQRDALVGESDHGVSKSLYAKDPDGLEFEVMWALPADRWGDMEHEAIIRRLDLDAELAAEQSRPAERDH